MAFHIFLCRGGDVADVESIQHTLLNVYFVQLKVVR